MVISVGFSSYLRVIDGVLRGRDGVIPYQSYCFGSPNERVCRNTDEEELYVSELKEFGNLDDVLTLFLRAENPPHLVNYMMTPCFVGG